MIKITNRKNLPQIIVNAVSNDGYSSGGSDYTATTLIKPAYIVNLEKKHKDELQQDVADMLWAMYGTAVHYIIERAATESDLVEERFFAEVADKNISAQIDHYADGIITDAKLTGAYKVKKAMTEDDYEDWEAQLNIQAYLMRQNGYDIKGLQILAMVRDWSRAKHNPKSYNYEHGYPDQIEVINIPLWSEDAQKGYITHRIDLLANPEPCTQAERWQKPTRYAVMKPGGKRAVKLCDSEAEGLQIGMDKNIPDFYIEKREQPCVRCESYCLVSSFCDFWQKKQKSEELFK